MDYPGLDTHGIVVTFLGESSLSAGGQTVAGLEISSSQEAPAAPRVWSGPALASVTGPVAFGVASVLCHLFNTWLTCLT